MKHMNVIHPTTKLESKYANLTVFLAGSIEMGKAIDWQQSVIDSCKDLPVTFFNPRRKDWDSSWKQDPSNTQFLEQVEWELDALHQADVVFFNFVPNTMSPISLLELGLMLNHEKDTNPNLSHIYVCCPKDFHRWANVKITALHRYKAGTSVSYFEDLNKAISTFKIDFEDCV